MQYVGGWQTQGVLWTAHTLSQAAHTLATPLFGIPKRSYHLGTRFDVVDIGEWVIRHFALFPSIPFSLPWKSSFETDFFFLSELEHWHLLSQICHKFYFKYYVKITFFVKIISSKLNYHWQRRADVMLVKFNFSLRLHWYVTLVCYTSFVFFYKFI